MQQPIGTLLDRRGEAVRAIEELAQPHRVADRFVVGQRARCAAAPRARALDELHRDVEVVAVRTELEDLRHHAVFRRERLLQDRAVPLGRDRRRRRSPLRAGSPSAPRSVHHRGGGRGTRSRTARGRSACGRRCRSLRVPSAAALRRTRACSGRGGAGAGSAGTTMLPASSSRGAPRRRRR